jgi:DNA-directed RNA polymerase specialized sigma24 family protein
MTVSTDARRAATLVEGGAMAQREPSPDRDTGDGVSLGEDTEELAREFLQHRPRLLGVAYRLLGTIWDAEDIVADAMVRWLNVEREQIRDPAAFLITMVTRRALDQLLLDRWEDDAGLKILLRTAATDDDAAERMRTIFTKQLTPTVADLLDDANAAPTRAGLVSSQALGVALTRYVLRLPPVVDLSRAELIDWVSPTFQRYLVGMP